MDVVSQIVSTAQGYGVDPRLGLEVAIRESGANPNAPDGLAGEIGVFQVEPATGAMYGYSADDLRDPLKNIDAGIHYLADQLSQFGDPAQALAAYNWGPTRLAGAISNYGADWFVHIPASTQSYVNAVLTNVNSKYQAAPGGTDFSAAVGGVSASTIAWIVGAAIFAWLAFSES
jgi:soluble lytic murein transglycosylase-like protein